MKKMIRQGFGLMMAAMMAAGVTACGSAGTQPEASAAETTAATGTTTVAETTTAAETETSPAAEASTAAEEKGERVLRMDAMSNCGMPSPFLSSSKGSGYAVVQYVFDTLVWKDADGYMNLLAEDYSVADDHETYTFKLRDGITWHDGETFTAEDVKFSFDYYAEHEYSWVSVKPVKEARVVDDRTVEIELNDIYVPFIADIAASLPILPKHIYEKVEDPVSYQEKDAFVGTGPMMAESYDTESGVYTYVKNPNYYFGEVNVDRLILSPYEDPKTALLNGEIDVATTTSYKQALSMKDTENIHVLEGSSMWLTRLYFNFDNAALATKEVRQAIACAIDRQEIVDKAFGGSGVAGTDGYVHPDSQWYNDQIANRQKDVEKAKELLAAAGAKDTDGDGILEFQGQPMSFELLISEKDEAMAELLKAYLKEAGIELTVKAADDATVKSMIQEGSFTLAANGHGSFGGDPKYLAAFSADTTGAAKVTVQGGACWHSDEYDSLMKSSLTETDEAKRAELVDQMQVMIAEEVPTIAIYYKSNAAAYNSAVFDGFYYTPDGISSGVPYLYNKLILVSGTWNK